jgi:hypothetical protein
LRGWEVKRLRGQEVERLRGWELLSILKDAKELLKNKQTNLYAGVLFFNNSKKQRIVNYLMLLGEVKGKRTSKNSQVISKQSLSNYH